MGCPPHDYEWQDGQQVCHVCGVVDLSGARLVHDVRAALEARGVTVVDGRDPRTPKRPGSPG